MNKIQPDLKVIVTDEIIDFRAWGNKSKKDSAGPLIRIRSHNELDVKLKKEAPPIAGKRYSHRDVRSLERVVDTLHSSMSVRKPKPKTRSKTVDPRFRRSRSPVYKSLIASQSTSELKSGIMQVNPIKNRSLSACHMALDKNCVDGTPSKAITNQKGDATHTSESSQENSYTNIYQQMNISAGDSNLTKHALPISSNENIKEKELVPKTIERKSTSKTCISPYWDDPRLLEKYREVVRPILPIHKSKSAIALPAFKNSPQVKNDPVLVWQNWESPSYQYDDATDICNCSIINDTNIFNGRFYKKVHEFSPCIAYMVLGSVCGLLFVCSIGWIISQNVLWSFSTKPLVLEEQDYLFYVKYIGAAILNGLDVLYAKLYKILTLSLGLPPITSTKSLPTDRVSFLCILLLLYLQKHKLLQNYLPLQRSDVLSSTPHEPSSSWW